MVIIDGQSVHPAVAAAYRRLDAAFYKATGKRLSISSGHRTTAEQTAIFLARFRVQAFGGGPFGDVRWWKGRRYVRHSAAGTVAVPGTSLHESFRAIDVRDTGADAGVTVAGTPRAKWLRANAARFELNPRGYQFGEPWHLEYTGSLTTFAGGDFTPIEEELEYDDMKIITTGYRHALIWGGGAQTLSDRAADEEEKIWGTRIPLNTADYNREVERAETRGQAPVVDYAKLATALAPHLNATNLGPVLEAIEANKPPTAESIFQRFKAFWTTGK